jgi:hypothetical protein
VDVVLNIEPSGASRSSRAVGGNVTGEPVLGVLDQKRRILFVVVGINIEVDDMVTKVGQISLALTNTAGVRRAHVGGDLANNVAKSHLVLPHLLLAVDLGDGTQVQMGPGVGSNLMTLSIHALDNVNELGCDIDLALADVVASNEEGSLCVVLLHQVQDVRGKNLLWAVIVGESNSTRLDTSVDSISTVLDITSLGASNGRSIGTSRDDVLRACRTVLVVTAWRVAEVDVSATV